MRGGAPVEAAGGEVTRYCPARAAPRGAMILLADLLIGPTLHPSLPGGECRYQPTAPPPSVQCVYIHGEDPHTM